jgi:hypothetical protein
MAGVFSKTRNAMNGRKQWHQRFFCKKPVAQSDRLSYRSRPFNQPKQSMSEETTAPQAQQNQVQIDNSALKTSYANVVGIAANINEVYLTFGVNTDPYNPTPTEAVKLDNRVIMTPDAAKRLCLNLNATLAAYEQRFGVIELDLQKRIKG